MRTAYRSIALTGASSGLGRALAIEFAGPDVNLLLIGRNSQRLLAVAEECRLKGALVRIRVLDVRDRTALEEALWSFDQDTPIELLVANAGVSGWPTPAGQLEPEGETRRLMDINYLGMLNTIEPVLPRMVRRGRGRVAVISALAGLRAVPRMPGYSASKYAVRGYGVALRGMLAGTGVGVSVVYPGFVAPQEVSDTETEVGPAFERVARVISHHLVAGRSSIAVPFFTAAILAVTGLLPAALSDRIVTWFAKGRLPTPRP
ncbi:SDR family NAD(P)-dependent oxidoreductase [Chthonobacter albigriseus]|uniref:SDR family NAD(P)-dependent oxidoreductase n=1 Tax=Chthonobacter albigriseus TaxID=1683161 RepID=UPI0015EF7260|nr:SDR family NAD(P)-dependent oxidoreductase [Chthonobacter albigriseus]